MFLHVVRIRASKAPGNLFGRAASGQVCPDVLPQPGVQEFAGPPWLTGSDRRERLGRAAPIRSAPRGVAGVLAAQGAGGPPQHRRHRPQGMAVGQPLAQGLTFFGTQMRIANCWPDNTVAHQGT
jgi:hypothetical protein